MLSLKHFGFQWKLYIVKIILRITTSSLSPQTIEILIISEIIQAKVLTLKARYHY